MVKTANKTKPTEVQLEEFLASVEPAKRREEARELDRLFRDVTGFDPVMWGPSMVGYGRYHYRYKTGHEGDFLATGFSPRKAALSIYILPGYADFGHLLKDLGKHKTGKSCLYVNKLADIDLEVLGRLIHAGLDDLGKRWRVEPL